MGQFLFYYVRPEPATWVYMASFLAIGVYFMFSRVWSLRNLDVLLLLCLTPGLMMVYEGRKIGLSEQETGEASQLTPVTKFLRPADPTLLTLHGTNLQEPDYRASLLPAFDQIDQFSASSVDVSGAASEFKNPQNVVFGQRDDILGSRQSVVEHSLNGSGLTFAKETPASFRLIQSPGGADSQLFPSRVLQASSVTTSEQADSLQIDENVNASSTQADAESGQPESNTPVFWTSQRLQFYGFVWLLTVQGMLVIRMLVDTSLVRRPMLEPNLSIGGLTFLGVSLFLFLMANVLTCTPEDQMQKGMRLGPGYVLLNQIPDIAMHAELATPSATDQLPDSESLILSRERSILVARSLAVIANFIIVGGLIAIAAFHFGNIKTGVGVAVFCTLMPYTAQMTGRIDHVLPAAMIIGGIFFYRQPVLSGMFLGAAAGLVYFPFFLVPLWMSFYWQRGKRRFMCGFLATIGFMALGLALTGNQSLWAELQKMFGLFPVASENLGGVWGLGWHPYFRLPVLVAFGLLSFSFVAWPAQKNLGTLMSGSAAVMMAAQFGHGYGGGLFMAWFLPLATLTIFRPNLDDRIALRTVRLWRHKPQPVAGKTPEPVDLAQAG